MVSVKLSREEFAASPSNAGLPAFGVQSLAMAATAASQRDTPCERAQTPHEYTLGHHPFPMFPHVCAQSHDIDPDEYATFLWQVATQRPAIPAVAT